MTDYNVTTPSKSSLEHRVTMLEERLSQFEAKTGFMSAETMYESGKAWIARNPRAWRYIKQYADGCIDEQRRFSIQKACEELRDSDLVDKDELYKVNNSYAAVLTRFLVKELPELKPLVSMRKSKVDRFFR